MHNDAVPPPAENTADRPLDRRAEQPDGKSVEHGPDRPAPPSPDRGPSQSPSQSPRQSPRRSLSRPPSEVPIAPGVGNPLKVLSEICARFLIIAAALGVVIFLVIQLRIVVIPVAIALLLAALLAPLVRTAVDRLRLPRGLATGLVLVGGIALLGAVLSFVVNAFIAGLPDLRQSLLQSYQLNIKPLLAGPPFRVPASQLDNLPDVLNRSIAANTEAITSGALTTAATVGELASGLALGLFVLIFFLYDGGRIWRFLLLGIPLAHRRRADIAGQRAFASLVGYTRATVVVAVVDAVGIGIGLWIVGTPLVVPLAALVFLGAFIPVVGAVLSGVVAVLVALVANGLGPALVVLAVVIAVMQLESHVLQPVLLGRAVQLHPLSVVLAVAGGVVISGISGALLAVPLIAVLSAGIRSLVTPDEPDPSTIDPTDPDHGKGGPVDARLRTRLVRVATSMVGRSKPKD